MSHPDADRPGTCCHFCKWWLRGKSILIGECRRAPPVFIDNPREARAWPHTKRDDWCGEYQEESK